MHVYSASHLVFVARMCCILCALQDVIKLNEKHVQLAADIRTLWLQSFDF